MTDFRRSMLPVAPDERLRDAFAQLVANYQSRDLSPEARWTLQGRAQLGQSPRLPFEPDAFDTNTNVGIPRVQSPPGLEFPTAGPGPGDKKVPVQKPFPGAQSVEIHPYHLPKSKKEKD